VGGGVEAMLASRWSAKLEYLYMGTPSTSLAPGINSSESTSSNLFRIGVNYHF
jgi:outer membrane immunogenic protein